MKYLNDSELLATMPGAINWHAYYFLDLCISFVEMETNIRNQYSLQGHPFYHVHETLEPFAGH